MASDSPFDLLEVVNNNIYLNYMSKHVLLKNTNLVISYNYEEKILEKHMKTSDPTDIEILKELNPFVIFKMKALELTIKSWVENDDKQCRKGYGTML